MAWDAITNETKPSLAARPTQLSWRKSFIRVRSREVCPTVSLLLEYPIRATSVCEIARLADQRSSLVSYVSSGFACKTQG
jgi:hypothetical protein